MWQHARGEGSFHCPLVNLVGRVFVHPQSILGSFIKVIDMALVCQIC